MQEMLCQFQNANYEYNEENLNLMLDKINNKEFKMKKFNIDLAMMKVNNIWYSPSSFNSLILAASSMIRYPQPL